jgi:hypothetical protein
MAYASRFEVPVAALKTEAAFYDEADDVAQHIDGVRQKLEAQNDEFEMLLEYYVANRGRLDIAHRSACHPGMETANLGTGDESWYYLDERGNKIWVQNLDLDRAKATSNGGAGVKATGAFCELRQKDNRRVVVTVPKAKRHYALPSDFRRRCFEVEAQDIRARQGRAANIRTVAAPTADERYVEEQRALAAAAGSRAQRSAAAVYRPPSSAAEAETRLEMLRAEEALLWERLNDDA